MCPDKRPPCCLPRLCLSAQRTAADRTDLGRPACGGPASEEGAADSSGKTPRGHTQEQGGGGPALRSALGRPRALQGRPPPPRGGPRASHLGACEGRREGADVPGGSVSLLHRPELGRAARGGTARRGGGLRVSERRQPRREQNGARANLGRKCETEKGSRVSGEAGTASARGKPAPRAENPGQPRGASCQVRKPGPQGPRPLPRASVLHPPARATLPWGTVLVQADLPLACGSHLAQKCPWAAPPSSPHLDTPSPMTGLRRATKGRVFLKQLREPFFLSPFLLL